MEKEGSILTSSEELRMRRETQVLEEKPIPPLRLTFYELWATPFQSPFLVNLLRSPGIDSQPGGIDSLE